MSFCPHMPIYSPSSLIWDTDDLVNNFFPKEMLMPFFLSYSMNHFQEETTGHVFQVFIMLSLQSLYSRNPYHLRMWLIYCPHTCVCVQAYDVCVLAHSGQQFPLRRAGCASVLYRRLHRGIRSDLDSHQCHLHKHQLCQHQGARPTVGEHGSYW